MADDPKDPAAKAAAISLFTKGLVSQSEAARLADTSRQLVRHWAADIPIDQARDAVLAKLWRAELAEQRKGAKARKPRDRK
jgi:hypothetical protein